jgi:hypothetical protein
MVDPSEGFFFAGNRPGSRFEFSFSTTPSPLGYLAERRLEHLLSRQGSCV